MNLGLDRERAFPFFYILVLLTDFNFNSDYHKIYVLNETALCFVS